MNYKSETEKRETKLSLYITKEIKEKLKELALKKDRSVNSLIVEMIKKEVKQINFNA